MTYEASAVFLLTQSRGDSGPLSIICLQQCKISWGIAVDIGSCQPPLHMSSVMQAWTCLCLVRCLLSIQYSHSNTFSKLCGKACCVSVCLQTKIRVSYMILNHYQAQPFYAPICLTLQSQAGSIRNTPHTTQKEAIWYPETNPNTKNLL